MLFMPKQIGSLCFGVLWIAFQNKDLTHASFIVLLRVIFQKSFLPPVMHPEIVSGMGIATKSPFGTESSLFSNEMMQFLFEQVIE